MQLKDAADMICSAINRCSVVYAMAGTIGGSRGDSGGLNEPPSHHPHFFQILYENEIRWSQ